MMTDQEIRETLREMLANWEICMQLAMDAGASKEGATKIVRQYFSTICGALKQYNQYHWLWVCGVHHRPRPNGLVNHWQNKKTSGE